MLPLFVYQAAARLHAPLVSGETLHRHALELLAAGAHADAERWFEVAAWIYRRELCIEPLARLRVHQLMGRMGHPDSKPLADGPGRVPDPAGMLEIVRRLNRLDRLERLEAPFDLRDARLVLAEWIERTEQHSGQRSAHSAPTAQAA